MPSINIIKTLIVSLVSYSTAIICAQANNLYIEDVSELVVVSLERNDARANLIGFVGGNGLRNNKGRTRNFMGTQRQKFHEAKYNYYLYPNPNSRRKATYPYRASEENLNRIKALVRFLTDRNSLPTILIGFSRGSVDVSIYAIKYPSSIAGIVLISGVYANSSRRASDYSLDLLIGDEILVPILIVHHEGDECMVSYPEEAKLFFESVKVPKKDMVLVSGGKKTGRECGPFHHHGYEGVEAKATNAIIKWLEKIK